MRTAIAAIVVCASIASAHAATEKTLSPAPGNNPALIRTTTVLSTDSALVRAAKLTVRSRLHLTPTNVSMIDDSTVGHAPSVFSEPVVSHDARVLGVSAPNSGGGSATPASTNRPGAKVSASGPVVVGPYGVSAPSTAPRASSMQPH